MSLGCQMFGVETVTSLHCSQIEMSSVKRSGFLPSASESRLVEHSRTEPPPHPPLPGDRRYRKQTSSIIYRPVGVELGQVFTVGRLVHSALHDFLISLLLPVFLFPSFLSLHGVSQLVALWPTSGPLSWLDWVTVYPLHYKIYTSSQQFGLTPSWMSFLSFFILKFFQMATFC